MSFNDEELIISTLREIFQVLKEDILEDIKTLLNANQSNFLDEFLKYNKQWTYLILVNDNVSEVFKSNCIEGLNTLKKTHKLDKQYKVKKDMINLLKASFIELCYELKLITINSTNIEMNEFNNICMYKRNYIDELRHKLSTVNSEGLGKNLESKFRHVLSTFVIEQSNTIQYSYDDVVGIDKYDYLNGTDFILNYGNRKIRIDITARDDKAKDHMQLIRKYNLFMLYSRTGNLVINFDEPILVYVIPYYSENTIIDSMVEIYSNMEDSINLFLKYNNMI